MAGADSISSDGHGLSDAAATVIARDGWSAFRMRTIAQEAGVPLGEVFRAFPDRRAILARWSSDATRKVADQALAASPDDLGGGISSAESPRDRLFDLIMQRLDALDVAKPALRRLRDSPLAALALTGNLAGAAQAMAWLLEAADVSSQGLGGALRVQGLLAVYLATVRVWLTDDSADLGLTMKALDRNLARAEDYARRFADDRRSSTGDQARGSTVDHPLPARLDPPPGADQPAPPN